MAIKERIQEDLKNAMKSGDTAKRDALRVIASAIKQVEVDSRKVLTEDDVLGILTGEIKRRRDSISEATKAGRTDIADKEQYEVTLIETYLPQQLTREELEAEVRKAISESGAKTAKEMGNVMKVLMPRVKGRADGKLVNEVVKALLGG
ncbi:MAG: GatB/YqeY domain-containing protein [Anaerolinea sp.]|nr:GatB/YqeY domain-containing protein [Anaerolinea sp.]MCC6973265.1 GatB/YqeY domain-containing protein [Anaerolineae bacterium]